MSDMHDRINQMRKTVAQVAKREPKPTFGGPKEEAAAAVIIAAIRRMDPDWNAKVDVLKQEKGYSDYQCLAAWCGRILDAGEQMLHPPHPFFERGFVAAGNEGECPNCTRAFKAAWAGQEYCSDDCYLIATGQKQPPGLPPRDEPAAEMPAEA